MHNNQQNKPLGHQTPEYNANEINHYDVVRIRFFYVSRLNNRLLRLRCCTPTACCYIHQWVYMTVFAFFQSPPAKSTQLTRKSALEPFTYTSFSWSSPHLCRESSSLFLEASQTDCQSTRVDIEIHMLYQNLLQHCAACSAGFISSPPHASYRGLPSCNRHNMGGAQAEMIGLH